ncbi:MAG: TonB family protein [Planctomycetota bacterium]|nr:TonB family protein [Planctomycetota bacterium]
MENKGFSLIVGFSVVLHAVVLYAWAGPVFTPPVVELVVGEMSVALTVIPEEPAQEPEEVVEEPIEEPLEVVEETIEEPVEPVEVVEEPVEDPVEEVAEEPVETIRAPVQVPVEVAPEPVEEVKQPGREVFEEPAEKVPAVARVREPADVQPAPASLPRIGVQTEPRELEGHVNKPPPYPRRGRRTRKEFAGRSVLLEIEVLADGKVREIRILEGCGGDGVDPKVARAVELSVIEAIREWRWHPGELDGVAVGALVKHRIRFELPEKRKGLLGRF